MLHSSLVTACVIVLAASASAQDSPRTAHAEKIPGAIKHAGIYHVSTGTWTRTLGAVANFGPDTIYSNTAESGYFATTGGNGGFAPGSEIFDEGLLPSSSNTDHPAANRDTYNVNCIEIGYCDLATGPGSWELSFYTSFTPCTFSDAADARITTGPAMANGCWILALDLTGGNEICLGADGGDGFDVSGAFNTFGWSYRYTGAGTASAGFLLCGDPQSTDPNWVLGGPPTDGTNTYFGPSSLCTPEIATGLMTEDSFWLEDPNNPGGPFGTSNCYWFGGYNNINGCGGPSNPYASWYMELQADTSLCFCSTCAISVPNGCLSNPNSTGVNSRMVVTGSAAVVDDDVTLTAMVPDYSFGFFIVAQTAGFVANPGGSSGNICLGSNVGRFSNLASSSGPAGILEISTTAGQWSLTSIPQASGPAAAAVPGTSAHFQCWHRDSSPSGPTSNFSDGVIVIWQ